MRKVFYTVIGFLLLSFLAGCGGSNSVTATISDVTYETTTASFLLTVEDDANEITGNINIRLVQTASGSEISLRTTTFDALTDGTETYEYANLTASTEYTIHISATIGRSTVVLASQTFITKPEDNVITTVEEFLAIDENRTGNFELGNDLDFSGVTYEIPFVSTTNPFSGTFDGKGYTLSNITISTMDTYTGVFGYISTGKIYNVTLENVTIGTEENPIAITKASRVGLLAGYISTSAAIIDGVTIKDSEMNFSASTSIYTYVGGLVGENNQGTITDVELDNVDIAVKTISYGRVKLGGVVGYMNDPATLKNVKSNANINYTMDGTNLLDKTLNMAIGGVIGDYNAQNTNKSIENVYSTGDITATLDFGTAVNTSGVSYTVNIGGIAGIAYSNIEGAFYGGSIEVNHEANENEAGVNKTFSVGGLFGFYGSSRVSSEMVRLGNEQTININVSDDVRVRASQTVGYKDSTAVLAIGVYGPLHLMINDVSFTDTDTSIIYDTLNPTEYFTNTWLSDAYTALYS